MKTSEYNKLYKQLNTLKDVEKLKNQYEKGMLESILSHKIVRNTKKNYYKIKNKSKRIVSEWKNGKSFLKIANELEFAPVMIASMILENNGVKKSEIRKWVKDTDSIEDDRIRRELKEAELNDVIYSQSGIEERALEGKKAEEKIEKWLTGNKIEFLTEEDLREAGGKTPDFVLKDELTVDGKRIHWIESKASFGDRKKMSTDIKKQGDHYAEEHGSGMIVYWYGFLEDDNIVDQEKIMFKDKRFFEKV